MLLARQRQGLCPFGGIKIASADPGQGNEVALLVDIQPVDERLQLFVRGIILAVGEDFAKAFIDRIGAIAFFDSTFLGLELPSLDDDAADGLRSDFQGRCSWSPPGDRAAHGRSTQLKSFPPQGSEH
jgi:hypothetical protein